MTNRCQGELQKTIGAPAQAQKLEDLHQEARLTSTRMDSLEKLVLTRLDSMEKRHDAFQSIVIRDLGIILQKLTRSDERYEQILHIHQLAIAKPDEKLQSTKNATCSLTLDPSPSVSLPGIAEPITARKRKRSSANSQTDSQIDHESYCGTSLGTNLAPNQYAVATSQPFNVYQYRQPSVPFDRSQPISAITTNSDLLKTVTGHQPLGSKESTSLKPSESRPILQNITPSVLRASGFDQPPQATCGETIILDIQNTLQDHEPINTRPESDPQRKQRESRRIRGSGIDTAHFHSASTSFLPQRHLARPSRGFSDNNNKAQFGTIPKGEGNNSTGITATSKSAVITTAPRPLTTVNSNQILSDANMTSQTSAGGGFEGRDSQFAFQPILARAQSARSPQNGVCLKYPAQPFID
ncbi:hypothetical protein HWV62_22407 [Athelia sp. TMB]|nr:hypothetical protein HWV62_26212 [Athelia sp. TMB]KAF7983393.1 hypothetical protein HWV62_22407 [Athelia sp. TMB]